MSSFASSGIIIFVQKDVHWKKDLTFNSKGKQFDLFGNSVYHSISSSVSSELILQHERSACENVVITIVETHSHQWLQEVTSDDRGRIVLH